MTTINEISNHIMSYFDGTLDAFGYTAQSVNEISNPDESYMGTLNLQFREYPIDDDEKVETYCRESDAFEQYVIEFINSHWDEHHPLKELNPNSHYIFITCQTPMEILSRYISMMNPFSLSLL